MPEEVPADPYRDHVGIHPQRQEGLYYAGFAITTGRVSAAQLRTLADLASRHGDGQLRTTGMQNVVILGIAREHLGPFTGEAEAAGLALEASPFRRGTTTCTGTQFCKLAITETKAFGAWLVEEMERRLPGFSQEIRLSVTGCPNSCGQHWIADIGLQGVKVRTPEGEQVDGYEIFVGGGLGGGAAFARRTGIRVPAESVPEALENLLREAAALAGPGERVRDVLRRLEGADLTRYAGTAAGR